MIQLTFPDNSSREFAAGVTGREVAEVDFQVACQEGRRDGARRAARDLSDPIDENARIEIVTRDDPRALEPHPA